MATNIISIIGIDNAIVRKLKAKDASTFTNFVDLTRTPKGRESLSSQTGISLQEISNWAVQAELLRIPDMKAEEAVELINAGIYSVEQLKKADKEDILSIVYKNNDARNEKTILTEEKLLQLQKAKPSSASPFDFSDLSDLYPGLDTADEKNVLGIYTDLSDVISDLGKGIAEAQHALDVHSIDVQNQIFEDEKLNGYGLNATWYVMPEVEFNLKMDYSVTKEQKTNAEYKIDEDGKKVLKTGLSAPFRRIKIMPTNATTQNLYKSEINQQSTLKVRFVPVPPSEKYIVRKVIPDCVGKTLGEAKALLEENEITNYHIINAIEAEVPNSDDSLKVISQILDLPGKSSRIAKASEILPIGGVIKLKV